MYIVYQTTNLINGKIYVGVHNGSNPDYLGSGVAITRAIKKYGKENFNRKILFKCKSSKEAYWIEEIIVSQAYINRFNTYNMTVGGKGGVGGITGNIPWNKGKGYLYTDEMRKNMSDAHIGNIPWNKDKKMLSLLGENNPMYGKYHSEETKQKMSDAKKGKSSPLKGRKLSEEHKRKLSESHKGKPSPMKGKITSEETRHKQSESAKKRWAKVKQEKNK